MTFSLLRSTAVFAALTFASQAQAASIIVDATSSGFCRSDGLCNNLAHDGFQNNFAGVIGDPNFDHRNFFSFSLPLGSVTGAILSIFNDGRNYTQQPATAYTVRGISTDSYEGFGTGTTFGSINVSAADTGVSHFVDIVLNSAAITQLNAKAGGSILLGGSVDGVNSSPNQLFGYVVGGRPAYLTLSNDSVAGSVPEPEGWVMLLLGFGIIGFAMRRRSNVRTTISYA